MSSSRRCLALLSLFAGLLCARADAQSAGGYRVAGKVVSLTDGHPLQNASISLTTVPDRKPFRTAVAAPEGVFSFDNLPAGKYELTGEAPGFVPTSYDQHGGFNTAVVTGSTVSAESLVLQLIPMASLSGTITDVSGDPVHPANVLLFRQVEDFGPGPVVPAGAAATDDLGRYEFSRLAAGSYLVAVQAQPWYAAVPQVIPAVGPGVTGPSDPALDVAYPITYYPGVTEAQRASPVQLRGGESTADLRLNPVPALQVTVHQLVPTEPPTPVRGAARTFVQRNYPQVQTYIFGTKQNIPAPVQFKGSDAVIGGVAPGDYVLYSNGSSGPTNPQVQIQLTHSLTAESVSPENLIHAHLVLHFANGSAIPAHTGLGLTVASSRMELEPFFTDAKGEVDVDLAPGDYFLQVDGVSDGVPAPMFVRQVTAGTTAVPANPLHIASHDGHADYSVTLAPGNIKLDGFAQTGGKPAAGVFILLVPADEVANPRNWRTQQSDLDGSFDLSAVGPGDYLAFAIDHGWQLDWHNGSVLAKYLAGATRVNIPDGAARDSHLAEPVRVQPKL